MWFFSSTSAEYQNLLDKVFSKGNIEREVRELHALIQQKERLEGEINGQQWWEEEDVRNLVGVLREIVQKLKQYERIFVLLGRMSSKFEDKQHSSHDLAHAAKQLQEDVGISISDLVDMYEKQIQSIERKDMQSYFSSGKQASPEEIRRILSQLGAKRSKLTRAVSALLLVIALAFAYKVDLHYTARAWTVPFTDTQTAVEEEFYQKTGVRIYASADSDVFSVLRALDTLYGDSKVLKRVGLKRVIVTEETGGGSHYLGLFIDEIVVAEASEEGRFLGDFFHELGHAIHATHPDRSTFEREAKRLFDETGEKDRKELGELLSAPFYKIKKIFGSSNTLKEQIARFYAARMLDYWYFHQDHGRVPTVDEICNLESYRSMENKEIFRSLMELFHKYGFFPESS